MSNPYTPGPGDQETWPASTTNPNDPRNDDDDINYAIVEHNIKKQLTKSVSD